MPKNLLLVMLLGGSCCLAGCGGSSGPEGPRQLVSIAVQPGSAQVIAPDGTVPFSATGTFDQAPTVEANLPVQWASSDSSIATVDANSGIATCISVGGPVTVTGSATGKGGTVQGSGLLTCQLSPNPVVKLDPPGIGVQCQSAGAGVCGCFFPAGNKVTVTNVGGAPLDIVKVAMLNGTQGFSQTSNCGAALDTGQSCQIDVGFKPLQLLTSRDDVVITDKLPTARSM